ncbi:MAG TPA: class I SAM-dependent methyltransferase [Vicinamibacterales bacterium]|jgi:predicted methyltransferase|nr:class I SAM-dependent methyltransferase [Vicinamibacterales bacterium]
MSMTFGRLRLCLLASVLGLGAFYAGTRIVVLRRAAPPVHPITDRQIAGIATDPGWMDRQARQQEEDPDRALSLIGITPGMTVADIGAGSGYMTIRLARMTGPRGRVYANDIQPALLQIVRQKADAEHLANITIVAGTETSANLPAGAIDIALLVDVYHEFSHPQEMVRSIRQALKPDGRLVLVEYRKEDTTLPIADTHRLSITDARAEIEPEGFTFDAVIESLPRQHIIVFRRSEYS